MIFKRRGADPEIERRALDQARWLIRDHKDEAEAVLAAKLQRPNLTPANRQRYKLTADALKQLRRREKAEAAAAGTSTALTVWRPSLFSVAGLRSLFGMKSASKKRRRP